MSKLIEENSVILFQGDSITDCGRNGEDPNSLGEGYVSMIIAMLSEKYSQYNSKYLNRGISGDRIGDLAIRWKTDCIDLKPDLLSILIGVNDTLITPARQFEVEYRELLRRTKKELDVKIIMCEPFLLLYSNNPCRDDLNPKIEIVHKLAKEFEAVLIPLDKVFHDSCSLQPPEYWASDSVHPTPEGHSLIAKTWLEHVDVI
ncbi:MAG: SGNH/GDSL hydrolase family protein [Candidatus Brocadiaceae bacterium]|nr:SGNH/GDSL hydrolase family protein [Candidatus Brocadiaceae bacterium]